MATRSVAKDFYKLQKNISSFSNGEARVLSFDDELTKFEIELNIKDGFYKDGIFTFEVCVTNKYPVNAPTVSFKSQIFHPNIGDGYENDMVCLNLLEEDWQVTNDLEDVAQGMLFLVKNPELNDALNPLFSGMSDNDDDDDECLKSFTKLVRQSLEGGEIEGIVFERNPGLVQKDKVIAELEMSEAKNVQETSQGKPEMAYSTFHHANPALALPENLNFPIYETVMNISSKDELYRCGLFWVYNNFTSFSTNREAVCKKAGCPKWLEKLAYLMFSGTTNKKANIFSRKLQSFRTFLFLSRTLMWQR